MKISRKILVSLLSTALIPLVLFSLIAYVSIERTLLRSAEDRLKSDALTYANTVVGMMEQAADEVESWSKLEGLQGVFTGEDLDLRMGLLLRNLNESNHFLEIWCLDTNGKIIAASDFFKAGTIRTGDTAVERSLAGLHYISNIVPFDNQSDDIQFSIVMSAPIYAAFDEDTVIGAVVAFYNWDNVITFTKRLNSSYTDSHEEIELMDNGHIIIASSDPLRMLKPSSAVHPEIVREYAHVDHSEYDISYRAHATMDKHTILAATRQLASVVLGGALFVTLAIIMVSLLLTRIISNPIISLSETARQIAGGDLDVHPAFQSSDEIGQLALDLDVMRNNLKGHIQSLDTIVLERTSELEATVHQLRQEITDRKAAESTVDVQQQQLVQADKMVSLGILVSGVAHEINNPNGLIGLNTSILKEVWSRALPVLDEYAEEHGDFSLGPMNYSDMREHMNRIFDELENSSQRIQAIVSDLKEFSQKRDDRDFESVDVNKLVYSAIALVQQHLDKKTHSVVVQLEENLPHVYAVSQRLEQVLVNLLLNAADSLSDMSCAITIQTHLDPISRQVSITVIDEGCGINKEDLLYIVDPFFTTKREMGGTGLGLSVSSSIMAEHGGSLHFESEPGKGTSATMMIPITESNTEPS